MTQKKFDKNMLMSLIEKRKVALLSSKEVDLEAIDSVEAPYDWEPVMKRYFPKCRTFARRHFMHGLANGFVHSFVYDSVGLVVEYLAAAGDTIRVLGINMSDPMTEPDDEESAVEHAKEAMQSDDVNLHAADFYKVFMLVRLDSKLAFISVEADGKCSSFGIFNPALSQDETEVAFEDMVIEESRSNGDRKGSIVSLANMRNPEIGWDNEEKSFTEIVELPPEKFHKRLKFGGIDDWFDNYFDYDEFIEIAGM
jgi:hypothetical protein